MITLYGAGPFFGLPDPSPFVMKAETLLRMSKLAYDKKQMSRSKAPKGKIPYIEDDGQLLGDSTFIRWHLEQKYRIDFDAKLSAEQRAVAWAFEKMAEDHLYWAIVDTRWTDNANFVRGPEEFFKAAPAPIRPLVMALIKRQVRKALHSQGMGRHRPHEIAVLGSRSLTAIADYLGDKPFFMGVEPSGADATIFAFVAGAMCPVFQSPIQQAAASHDNLRRYVGRMTAQFYPERGEIAGCEAAA